jgi:hypothetical protein
MSSANAILLGRRTAPVAPRRSGVKSGLFTIERLLEGRQGVMARKVVNRKELRAQNDAAEAREKTKKSPKEKAAKTPKAKKEKVAKDPKAKKPSRKKTAKEARMKAYWGVYNQGMKRLAMFEYSDKKAAEKKAADLMASSRTNHFIQLVKEAITE